MNIIFKKIQFITLHILSFIFFVGVANTKEKDISDIEKALGIKEIDCKKDPATCLIDIDSLLDKLTHEYAQKNKDLKLTDTKERIEENKNFGPVTKISRAELIILNKITAKQRREIFNLGEVRFFGNLSIKVHKCIKNTNSFNENNLMLLTVFDNKIDDDNLLVFHGWVVSSNPSLSTLEHPIYEVIPVDCVSEKKDK